MSKDSPGWSLSCILVYLYPGNEKRKEKEIMIQHYNSYAIIDAGRKQVIKSFFLLTLSYTSLNQCIHFRLVIHP